MKVIYIYIYTCIYIHYIYIYYIYIYIHLMMLGQFIKSQDRLRSVQREVLMVGEGSPLSSIGAMQTQVRNTCCDKRSATYVITPDNV